MPLNANTQLVYSAARGGASALRYIGTGANVVVTANSTVNSEISTSNSTLDPVTGATITGVWWSLVGNTATITRVVNSTVNVLVGVLSGSGSWGRNDGWMGGSDALSLAGNVVVTYGTSASGTVYLEFKRQYDGGDNTVEHQ